jgi:ABC-type transport system substrate-binding protein
MEESTTRSRWWGLAAATRSEERAKRSAAAGVAAAVVALAFVALGCGTSGTTAGPPDTGAGVVADNPEVSIAPSGTPQMGGRLVYGLEAESDGFDPTKNRWAISGLQVAYTVYDPLFALDANGVAQPYAIATSSHNADYTVWTSTLRPNLVFHNGEKATAKSLQKQVEAFHSAPLTAPAIRPYKSSRIIDDLTIEITLNTPWAQFPYVLTGQGGALVAPEVFDNPQGNRNPIGTGPFKFVEWKTDDHLTVTRNDQYWMKDANGQQLPYLKDIVFKPIPDSAARAKALESGDVNMIHDNHPTELAELKARAQNGELQYVPDRGETEETFLMFNTVQPPLDDPLLRQALAYATNPDDYLEISGDAPDQLADGPFAKTSKWYVDAGFPRYDLTKAKDLIAQYKAKHGDGPITFKIATLTNNENTAIVQKLQADYQEIGVDAQPDSIEQVQLITEAVTGKYDAMTFRLFGAADPDADYHFWAPINSTPPGTFGLNFSRLQSDQVQKDLDVGRQSPDFATRKAAYDDAQKQWATLVPYIWLDHVQWVIVADDTVRGIGNNPLPDPSGVANIPALPFATGAHRLTTAWLAPAK